jgi:single-stranded-DNA-specific exonuclease
MDETTKTPEKRWAVRELRQDLGLALASCLNISPLVAQVLINRGIETPEAAQSFLSARLTDLHSPFLLKDMDRATERIAAACTRKEKICICGDYDVDGITATTVVLLFLESAGAQVAFHIPSRLTEGYGMSTATVKKLHADGVSLIITVDCGVSAFDEVACAREHGIDVIVTDHHEPPDRLPEAYAIINPKQPGCPFPFKGLAGVGVAFNLVMALRTKLRDSGFWENGREPNLKQYLDLVALGTIADMVPMLDENRIFVRNGLDILGQGCRPGIKALKNVSGIPDGPITANMIGFRLAPRLNAAGRMAEADLAVRLLRSRKDDEAMAIARKIDEENTRRQQRERSILSEARSMVKKHDDLPDSLILSSPAWHPGVIGLCASRLSEEFSRPAILFAIDEKSGEGKGSARTVKGFDLYSAIKKCSSFLKAFGGHRDAAGLTVHVDNMDPFMQAFNAIVREQFATGNFQPMLAIDAEIPLGELSHVLLEQIETLAPFGPGNAEPVFSTRELTSYSSMVVGNGHLKLKIREDGQFFDAIGFNMGARYHLSNAAIRLAFVPQFNSYNGQKLVQLNLRDIKSM